MERHASRRSNLHLFDDFVPQRDEPRYLRRVNLLPVIRQTLVFHLFSASVDGKSSQAFCEPETTDSHYFIFFKNFFNSYSMQVNMTVDFYSRDLLPGS